MRRGYFGVELLSLRPGTRYGYRLDDGPVRPDPASRAQPDGVAGWSAVVRGESFPWGDSDWHGRPLEEAVFYELHVGTFSPVGTFDGVGRRLDDLRALGVTAVELLPVAEFSGRRNWGYDGVFPFAVHHSYGGLVGLQRLAQACHARAISLFVDVVYNHLGPEGNPLGAFGPYFTDRYRTPWGPALNFDGGGSDEVRRFFVESATWLTEVAHLDGLRVDAVHAVVDPTASPFFAELTEAVHAVGARSRHPRWLVAESVLNDPRVVVPGAAGGLGFDAMWNDDFHHALHVALTGERTGYFRDYDGVGDLGRALVDGFALAGRFSEYRGRRHGRPAGPIPAARFVVYGQNHDQVGNRPFGERIGALVPFEAAKLAAGMVLLSPFLPLVWMGEEYGESAPFQYFTSHRGRALADAVRRGRRADFVTSPGAHAPPDPQSPATFARSRLAWESRSRGRHRRLLALYRALLDLRREIVPSERLRPTEVGRDPDDPKVLWVARRPLAGRPASLAVFRFGDRPGTTRPPAPPRRLERRLASGDRRWGGPGASGPRELAPGVRPELPLDPWSFVVYSAGGAR